MRARTAGSIVGKSGGSSAASARNGKGGGNNNGANLPQALLAEEAPGREDERSIAFHVGVELQVPPSSVPTPLRVDDSERVG